MYLHQHPTYRRLSAQFARRSKHYPDEVAPHMRHTHYPDETEATAAAATATATAAAVSANNNGSSGLSSHDFVGWERIGKGGFGKVYRAKPRNGRGYRHGTDSDGYVAVKVVDKRALKDSAAEMRLAAEVAIHESVAHAGVVQLHESFEDDRFVYLVMEHCAAGDLWRYLRQRGSGGSDGSERLAALGEPEARHVMRQAAGAVAYLHAQGVLHRDLKLANLLLTRSMDVRVADFGLATWVGQSEPTTMCGTPSYISPEILARQPYGLEADVWALGCLLVTLLTGAQPFRDMSRITEDVVAAIKLPRTLSSDARHLIRALLRIDPAARIRSDRILAHPFFRLPTARLPTLAQLQDSARQADTADGARRFILPPRNPLIQPHHQQPTRAPHAATVDYEPLGGDHSHYSRHHNHQYHRHQMSSLPVPAPSVVPLGRAGSQSVRHEPPAAPRSMQYRPQSTDHAAHASDEGPAAAEDLVGFTTGRLLPMKRAMKNGKVYLRDDRLLVLDLTANPTLVAVDERHHAVYEFKRPQHVDALTPQTAFRTHAWSIQALPERVAKAVRVGMRCVAYLLAQQRRVKIASPQGRGWLFEDGGRDGAQATFKFVFFNGIKVEISRRRAEATVEIPSSQDLPNEIQKIPLTPGYQLPGDFGDSAADSRVPGKIRGVLAHAQEALRRAAEFDAVLREFEPPGPLAGRYDGAIAYPVDVVWDWDATAAARGYVPPGLRPRRGAAPAGSSSLAHTAGSATIVAPQWGAHVLDRRTVDDTPTRRLNLGPITRLVEEFNQPPTPAAPAPRSRAHAPLVLRTPNNPARPPDASPARLAFRDACFIPDVGWCMAAAERPDDPDDCLITLLFCDGCRVLINVKEQRASYADASAEYDDLPLDHAMPARLKERISWLPQFLSLMGLAI
ncbi:hypothetical protein GGI04_000422 [Coemansia thaxteri]|nr:hypothetical protein GGI04_000422 [Coemansia thaxteri]KAJ2473877.1 hypothetical protein GGI02_000556 [Coemansia sp. RSA 2322]